jgi:hypothetical protein
MDILAAVKAERDRLNKVIALLEGTPTTTIVRTTKTARKKHGHKWTAAEKKAMSVRQKAIWAKKKKH